MAVADAISNLLLYIVSFYGIAITYAPLSFIVNKNVLYNSVLLE